MIQPQCAKCKSKFCREGEGKAESLPQFCPMKNFGETIERTVPRYGQADVAQIYVPSTIGEKESYEQVRGVRMAVRPRIREIAELAKKMNAKDIGVAFCSGLSDEAATAVEILESHGLTIHSVCCKCGGIDKTRYGVPAECKISDPKKFEAACNPIIQAEILNNIKPVFNVIIGLCVGHDMLFTMASKAPVTTLIAKDRVTGHNPLASLYAGYVKRLT